MAFNLDQIESSRFFEQFLVRKKSGEGRVALRNSGRADFEVSGDQRVSIQYRIIIPDIGIFDLEQVVPRFMVDTMVIRDGFLTRENRFYDVKCLVKGDDRDPVRRWIGISNEPFENNLVAIGLKDVRAFGSHFS